MFHFREIDGVHAACVNGRLLTETDEDEFLEVFRMPLDELVKEVLEGNIPDGKTQVAALRVAAMLKREGETSNEA